MERPKFTPAKQTTGLPALLKFTVLDERYTPSYIAEGAYHITLTGRSDERTEDPYYEPCQFTTSLTVTPPEGCYLEICTDDSLSDQGYTFSTGTSKYIFNEEEVTVSLTKSREDAPDLSLPLHGLIMLIVHPSKSVHLSRSIPEGYAPPVSSSSGQRQVRRRQTVSGRAHMSNMM